MSIGISTYDNDSRLHFPRGPTFNGIVRVLNGRDGVMACLRLRLCQVRCRVFEFIGVGG